MNMKPWHTSIGFGVITLQDFDDYVIVAAGTGIISCEKKPSPATTRHHTSVAPSRYCWGGRATGINGYGHVLRYHEYASPVPPPPLLLFCFAQKKEAGAAADDTDKDQHHHREEAPLGSAGEDEPGAETGTDSAKGGDVGEGGRSEGGGADAGSGAGAGAGGSGGGNPPAPGAVLLDGSYDKELSSIRGQVRSSYYSTTSCAVLVVACFAVDWGGLGWHRGEAVLL